MRVINYGQPFCTPTRNGVPLGALEADVAPFPMKMEGGFSLSWFLQAVAIGVTISLTTTTILDYLRARRLRQVRH